MTPYRTPGRPPEPPEKRIFARNVLWPDWMVVVAMIAVATLVAFLRTEARWRYEPATSGQP